MKIISINRLLFTLFCFALLSSCSTSRFLNNEYLLVSNSVQIDDNDVPSDKLNNYIQQKANKRFLGLLRVNPYLYLSTSESKDGSLGNWFNKSFSSPPILLDSSLVEQSALQMESYLKNIGYFNATTSYEVKIHNHKSKVFYKADCGPLYTINKYDYSIPDSLIRSIVFKSLNDQLIHAGAAFNVYHLDDERSRLTRLLKNHGYYYFTNEYIYYEADTSLNSHQANIHLFIDNDKQIDPEDPESYIEKTHKQYLLKNIFLFPAFDPLRADSLPPDTLKVHPVKRGAADSNNVYKIIYHGKQRLNPRLLTQSVFFYPNEIYSYKFVNESYKKLSALPLSRFVDISFNDLSEAGPNEADTGFLDCNIRINRRPVNAISVETEITNSAGNPGLAGNIIFRNYNLFRGGEEFRIKLRGGMELQRSAEEDARKFLFFNTVETGIEAGLKFPRFLIPVRQERFPKFFKPSSTIISGLNYLLRPEYERYIFNMSFGYNWSSNDNIRHSFFPVELNSVSIFPDDSSSFFQQLEETTDIRLRQQYTDHITTGMRYNFIFSNQKINKFIDFVYFNSVLETAGNLLNTYSELTDASRDAEGRRMLFSIPYSQYFRFDLDMRYYHFFDPYNQLVSRIRMGMGIPYGNSEALPFEKGFFSGGANGMRGWNLRSLGPGSFSGDTEGQYDRLGDMLLEASIEYRFPLYRLLKAAAFIDAGNIWLLNESSELPGGKFEFSNFIPELAVDGGLGLRADFNFFILRLDAALPLRNPDKGLTDRWINSVKLKNFNWNFAIGYPF